MSPADEKPIIHWVSARFAIPFFRLAMQKVVGSSPISRSLRNPCSAAFSAQLTQPASVFRLEPFLRESSLIERAADAQR
jgi:hypothetical protein